MVTISGMYECPVDGAKGCALFKFEYKNHCLMGQNGDLDYLKAMVDLEEEFPPPHDIF